MIMIKIQCALNMNIAQAVTRRNIGYILSKENVYFQGKQFSQFYFRSGYSPGGRVNKTYLPGC